jgi:two-component system sensor histidine kinase MprB
MSLRRRLTLLSGLAVAVTVIAASGIGYVAVRSQLRGEVDDSLRGAGRAAARFEQGPDRFPRPPPGASTRRLGGPQLVAAIFDRRGRRVAQLGEGRVITRRAEFAQVAAGHSEPYFADAQTRLGHLRLYVSRVPGGYAAVTARTVDETDDVLGHLRLLFAALILAGTALAALLGRAIAGATVTPIVRLEGAAAHVAETRDLTQRIDERGPGEVVGLSRQFNLMLDALERSSHALEESVIGQRRLIADASHELRTPITTLRTNVEVLESVHLLSDRQRTELLADVKSQLEDFSALIDDIIELARSAEPVRREAFEAVALDRVAEEAVEWARRHWPDIGFSAELEPTVMEGARERLARAVRNLLENAAKWSAPGQMVKLTMTGGRLVVRDHGPGIEPSELHRVFDRFHRGPGAEPANPGSGLGLAIVREVAESHGGSVEAVNAPEGGAELRWTLGRGASRPEELSAHVEHDLAGRAARVDHL